MLRLPRYCPTRHGRRQVGWTQCNRRVLTWILGCGYRSRSHGRNGYYIKTGNTISNSGIKYIDKLNIIGLCL